MSRTGGKRKSLGFGETLQKQTRSIDRNGHAAACARHSRHMQVACKKNNTRAGFKHSVLKDLFKKCDSQKLQLTATGLTEIKNQPNMKKMVILLTHGSR
jgi:hypothetical protein